MSASKPQNKKGELSGNVLSQRQAQEQVSQRQQQRTTPRRGRTRRTCGGEGELRHTKPRHNAWVPTGAPRLGAGAWNWKNTWELNRPGEGFKRAWYSRTWVIWGRWGRQATVKLYQKVHNYAERLGNRSPVPPQCLGIRQKPGSCLRFPVWGKGVRAGGMGVVLPANSCGVWEGWACCGELSSMGQACSIWDPRTALTKTRKSGVLSSLQRGTGSKQELMAGNKVCVGCSSSN